MACLDLYEGDLAEFGHAGFPVHSQTNSTNNVIREKPAASLCVQETVFVLRRAVFPPKRSSNDNTTA